jgi:hypothetical protein
MNVSNDDRRLSQRKLGGTSRLEDHRVKSLPGLNSNDIVQYAGHITVDEQKNGNLFYWFFEAQKVDSAKGESVPHISTMKFMFMSLFINNLH